MTAVRDDDDGEQDAESRLVGRIKWWTHRDLLLEVADRVILTEARDDALLARQELDVEKHDGDNLFPSLVLDKSDAALFFN